MINPTQKPLLLLEYLVWLCHSGSGVIVDLCCGTGSAAIASLRMGYDVIAMDKNAQQTKACQQRLDKFAKSKVVSAVTCTPLTTT